MPMSWSHTPEAYANAMLNLEDMPGATLRVMWAEWKTWQAEQRGSSETWEKLYLSFLAQSQPLGPARLASDIWEEVEKLRSCTMDAHEAYGCPYGCEPHLLPFSRVDDGATADAKC